jgi:GntR family transcriptional regulator
MSPDAALPLIASQPQYVLLAQALMKDITEGTHAVGSLLPTEFDLCKQFGVSRHTVREAIRMLQERGMVTRKRGVGTTVKAAKAESRYVQSTAQISDLMQYVEDTRLVTSESRDVIADGALAETLHCGVGQRWVCVSGVRYAGRERQPLALTEIYINPAYGGVRNLIGTLKVPVYTLIEKQYGVAIVEVQQEIRAVTVNAADAKRLSVKPGSAALHVTRRYLGANDHVLEIALSLHPGDRYSYSNSLRLHVPATQDA